MMRILAKTLKVLNSETDPGQVSLAVVLAMVAGFTPLLSLHNLLVLLLLILLRANLSTFILALGLFGSAGYLLDPLFHRTGLSLLTADSLREFWTALYNSVPGRLERVNNTVVTGSLAISLALAIPLFLLSNLLIRAYREKVLGMVRKSRLMQAISASKFYELYRSVSSLGGDR